MPARPPLPITLVRTRLVKVTRGKSEISKYGGNGSWGKLRNRLFADNLFVRISHVARIIARVHRGANIINPRRWIRIMAREFHISRESRTRDIPKIYRNNARVSGETW